MQVLFSKAVRKAIEDAKKNLVTVPIVGTTIPHEIVGKSGAGEVLLKPAGPGTGVIAGGGVRYVLELAGLRDIRTKCLRSNYPRNVVSATIQGLASLNSENDVGARRNKTVQEFLG